MNKKNEIDKNLWHSVKQNDRDAFDELYHRNIQLLFKYGLNLGVDKETVKDHIQELFSNLWRKRSQLNIEKSFINYILLSLRRSIFSKKEKLRTIEINEVDHDRPEEISNNEVTAFQQKSKQIKSALELLPKRQREAIFLKYYQNLEYIEIAKMMNIQIPAVYKLISAGIKKLRTLV